VVKTRTLVRPIANIEDKVRRILPKTKVSFGFLDRPQLDPSSSLDDTPAHSRLRMKKGSS
jgi:hypothetical protein